MTIRELSLLKKKENKNWKEIEDIINNKNLNIDISNVKKDYFYLLENEQYIFSLS